MKILPPIRINKMNVIDNSSELIKLGDVKSGDSILYRGDFYLVSGLNGFKTMQSCLIIKFVDGLSLYIDNSTLVKKVNAKIVVNNKGVKIGDVKLKDVKSGDVVKYGGDFYIVSSSKYDGKDCLITGFRDGFPMHIKNSELVEVVDAELIISRK